MIIVIINDFKISEFGTYRMNSRKNDHFSERFDVSRLIKEEDSMTWVTS
jgi:hypothetical protein